jgi:hypothetical protein
MYVYGILQEFVTFGFNAKKSSQEALKWMWGGADGMLADRSVISVTKCYVRCEVNCTGDVVCTWDGTVGTRQYAASIKVRALCWQFNRIPAGAHTMTWTSCCNIDSYST